MRKPFSLAAFVLGISVSLLGQMTADDVAKRAIGMLAGTAWEKARYFEFTFNVERDGKIATTYAHRWDRYTGDYRVSGKDPQGNDFVVVMNVNTKKGRVWKGGVEVTDTEEMLKRGYGRFINDTYWLLMPLKAMDPGVHRELAPEKSDACGRKWDVVRLSFDAGVGLTPADVYWMLVNRDSGLVDEWHMKLQGSKPEDPPQEVVFHDYKRFGDLLLSTRRELRGSNRAIVLGDIVVSHEVPKGAFER